MRRVSPVRLLAGVMVVFILVFLPLSIYLSGRNRNETTDALCAYTQAQWTATHEIALRFTRKGTESREFLINLFGPYPAC